jgi:hypothetical protein
MQRFLFAPSYPRGRSVISLACGPLIYLTFTGNDHAVTYLLVSLAKPPHSSSHCALPPTQVHQAFIFNPRTLKLSTCDIAERHRFKYLLSPVMLTLTENHLHMRVNLELACLLRLDLDPSLPSPLRRHFFRSHRRSGTPSCLVPSQASSKEMGFPNLLPPN